MLHQLAGKIRLDDKQLSLAQYSKSNNPTRASVLDLSCDSVAKAVRTQAGLASGPCPLFSCKYFNAPALSPHWGHSSENAVPIIDVKKAAK